MDLANLETAIYNRLVGDTGAGGLRNASAPLVTGVFVGTANSGQTMPFLLIDVAAERAQNAFSRDIFNAEFWVTTSAARFGSATPGQVYSDILARVYGDTVGGSVPTYGLHRHTLSLSGGWTATVAECMGAFPEHTDAAFVWRQIFKLTVSK